VSALAAFQEDPAAPSGWDVVFARAPKLAATMTTYLDELSGRLAPKSVVAAELTLRQFALHVALGDPKCQSVGDVTTAHVAGWKRALEERDPACEGTASKRTVFYKLATLKRCFAHLGDSGAFDVTTVVWPTPEREPRKSSTTKAASAPKPPSRALPKELEWDEIAAVAPQLAATMTAYLDQLSVSHRPTSVQATSLALRHLAALLVGLITDYRMWRGPSVNGFLLERDDGQPFDRRTVHRYVQRVAKRAGVGKVHPHQLRHTLATQCLNRGMSLEAIAALLGHRSPRMTLVYARISNENVADQYFQATHAVEANAKKLTSGARRARAQAEEHRRLLGNGQCTRPVDLDCRFQTICEGCGFFETGPQIVEILRRQRDDATAHVDRARAKLYDDLVNAIDAAPSVPGQPTPRLVG
jgi:integrase